MKGRSQAEKSSVYSLTDTTEVPHYPNVNCSIEASFVHSSRAKLQTTILISDEPVELKVLLNWDRNCLLEGFVVFSGIDESKWGCLSKQELRWFRNIKKAFYESDLAYKSGSPEDRCFEELFKAIDTAKTLRRSLRGEDWSNKDNKKRFIEFLNLEIPVCNACEDGFRLVDLRTEKEVNLELSNLIYLIRCMVHENENLNVAEYPDYHILLDWNWTERNECTGLIKDSTLRLNARFYWKRLRQVVAKFINGIESEINNHRGIMIFDTTCDPPLCSIRP